MMEFLNSHFGELLTAFSLICGAAATGIAAYYAMKYDLKLMHEKHTNLRDRVEEHVKNTDVHVHRRDNDPTGHYFVYGDPRSITPPAKKE